MAHPSSTALDIPSMTSTLTQALLEGDLLPQATACQIAERIGDFLASLERSGLSKRTQDEHAKNCKSLMPIVCNIVSALGPELAQSSPQDILFAAINEEGTYPHDSLSDYAQASLNKTCRRLHLWITS